MEKRSKSFSDLPDGIDEEIFLRLPVKSLLRCKSVCKPWLYTISHPHFTRSQLQRANVAFRNNPTLLNIINEKQIVLLRWVKYNVSATFLYLQERQRRRRQLLNQALDDADAQDLSGFHLNFNRVAIPGHINVARFVGFCNGIICLANYDDVYLWNPSIKKFKQLKFPNPRRNITVTIGFGYDDISDEYKLLRFVYENRFDVVPVAKVYYVNADHYLWREVQVPSLGTQINIWPSNVVVNRVLYFDGGDQLVSFDLHEEEFRIVPFPNPVPRKRSAILDFDGSVAMVFESGQEVDLWTLDSVSGDLSWTKKFSIEYGLNDPDTEIWLSCYLGANQFHGKKTLLGNFFVCEILYDYVKKETKYYGLREDYVSNYATYEETEISLCAVLEHNLVPPHAAFKYTETLVSLEGFEPEGQEGQE